MVRDEKKKKVIIRCTKEVTRRGLKYTYKKKKLMLINPGIHNKQGRGGVKDGGWERKERRGER